MSGSYQEGLAGEEEARQGEEHAREQIAGKLTLLWSEALGRKILNQHSDFYFDGGSHFLAPVLIAAINREMGLRLTVRDLELSRTIAKLTDLIYFERMRVDQSTVVPLANMRGSRKPVFIVHGVGGHVLGFYRLAKCLYPEQPVYGIQAQALVADREAVLKLEQMAEQYVADMRAVEPEGPYHLLGFSFGGLVAFEISRQLQAMGSQVGLLGMLDTRQPEWMRGVPSRGSIAQRIWERGRLLYLRTYRRNGRFLYLWRKLNERMQRVKYRLALSTGEGKLASTVRNVREINFVAGTSYQLPSSWRYSGKITLFRAENDPKEQPLPLDLNWGRYATEGVAIEELPGDHGQILNEPGLSVLARQLSDALAHEGGSVSFAGLRDLEEQLQVRSYREVGFDNKEGDEVHTGMSAIVSQGRVHIEI